MESLWEGRPFPRACALECQSFKYFSVLLPLYVCTGAKFVSLTSQDTHV